MRAPFPSHKCASVRAFGSEDASTPTPYNSRGFWMHDAEELKINIMCSSTLWFNPFPFPGAAPFDGKREGGSSPKKF
ncbi:hypothetical protein Y1Q_0013678 [Alligator mississippiensis]|uniref:Uncharacterized protein n=1 Tax=Alligator mississippiensis TaxID=8496 RepID=A0A151P3Q6_ALLMI|nr:hypothetical protein Y1Q_0013678 [Alligator mississippiensis]